MIEFNKFPILKNFILVLLRWYEFPLYPYKSHSEFDTSMKCESTELGPAAQAVKDVPPSLNSFSNEQFFQNPNFLSF